MTTPPTTNPTDRTRALRTLVVPPPATLFFLVIALAFATACRSKPITQTSIKDSDRDKVFTAARAVLKERFGTFSVIDQKAGRLVTTPHMPNALSTGRYLAIVELSNDDPPDIKIEVVTEVRSMTDDFRIVWTRYPRNKGEKEVEGYILEEIQARLEGRKPNLPNLDDLAPPPIEHQVPKSAPAKKERPLTPGQAPKLPEKD